MTRECKIGTSHINLKFSFSIRKGQVFISLFLRMDTPTCTQGLLLAPIQLSLLVVRSYVMSDAYQLISWCMKSTLTSVIFPGPHLLTFLLTIQVTHMIRESLEYFPCIQSTQIQSLHCLFSPKTTRDDPWAVRICHKHSWCRTNPTSQSNQTNKHKPKQDTWSNVISSFLQHCHMSRDLGILGRVGRQQSVRIHLLSSLLWEKMQPHAVN